MKKTFPLQIEGRHPDRVLDAIKNELRKYLKRERRRDLPAGAAFEMLTPGGGGWGAP